MEDRNHVENLDSNCKKCSEQSENDLLKLRMDAWRMNQQIGYEEKIESLRNKLYMSLLVIFILSLTLAIIK
jgi:hypothetical protein